MSNAPSHARASESYSQSLSSSSNSPLGQLEQEDSEFDLDARTLAREITEFWQVEDAALLVAEMGMQPVARIHRRMKSMSRRQKLTHVENLGGYFMTCLIGNAKPKPKEDSDRGDDVYERMVAAQKERGTY